MYGVKIAEHVRRGGRGTMDQDFVHKMKQRLIDMKMEILQNLIAEDEEFQELVESSDSKDLVDIASSDIDKKTLEALGAQDLKRLRLIDAALARIEADKYGICLKSGKPIPKERLEAIPYALYRIEYQNEVERRNR
jgi:RNA polymerase-binding transcription factor DksA